jgi:hypothetical protein
MKLEDEILISAYLDGELAGDEEQRVQKLLAASAEARQLADEMRAVRNRLQSLPRLSLPADFAAQTVRRAEQELAAANVVDAAVGKSSASARSPGESSTRTSETSTWASWRTYAWAAVALAAGVMIMLNSPLADRPEQIVKQTHTTSERPANVAVKSTDGSEAGPAPTIARPSDLVVGQPMPPASTTVDSAPPSVSSTGEASKFGSGGVGDITFGSVSAPNESSPIDALVLGSDGYVFVTLDVTPEAVEGREFKQLLEKHRIAVNENAVRGSRTRGKTDQGTTTPISKHLQEWVPENDSDEKSEALYLVDVSPEQLRGTLADLAASGEWCSQVAVSTKTLVKKTAKQEHGEAIGVEGSKTDESRKVAAKDAPQEPPKAMPAPSPAHPPAPAPEPKLPVGANQNDATSELFTPKPSERDIPTDEKLAPKADPGIRSDGKKGEGVQEVKPAPRATATEGKSEPPVTEVLGPPAVAKNRAPLRAIFVLRMVEPAPAAAAPVAPAAPK